MSDSRYSRRFFVKSVGLSALAVTGSSGFLPALAAGREDGRLTRDLAVDVITNQVGYLPNSAKHCVVPGKVKERFEIIYATNGDVVATGSMAAATRDFGSFAVGDFSGVRVPGYYCVRVGRRRSYPFRVGDDAYDDVLGKILHYFSRQRCGASDTGYMSPCHGDDGLRKDNGEHQDVAGGWHDASDVRKWVGATIYGVICLARVAQLAGSEAEKERVLEEVRWGNQYFFKMQEPAGYVMSHVGGDVLEHGDSNRWTNNRVEEAGDELVTIKPDEGRSTDAMTVFKPADDRVIQTDPLGTVGQYNFVRAEALTARLFAEVDPAYAGRCRKAAEKCWEWCMAKRPPKTAGQYGGAIISALELHRLTGSEAYRERAVAYARELLKLQVTEEVGSTPAISGFFRRRAGSNEPHRDVWHGRLPFLGLCLLLGRLPDHSDASRWRTGLKRYAKDYLLPIAARNSFGMVPLGLYAGEDPGGRKVGPYWYRYFMRPEGWWVGVNSHTASAGIGLVEAAQVLDDSELQTCAQRQLDWIVGGNPVQSSTMVGVGYNHPERFVNSVEFSPPTPEIPGAVMNGLGGTEEDQPALYDGQYHTAEYWTPMVAHTAWLIAALRAGRSF